MPEIIITDTVEKARTEYQGQLTTARARLAFFRMGQIDIELIEPVGEPSTWKDHLDQHGESLHHLAFRIKGMSEKIAYLNGTGIPLSSSANTRESGMRTSTAARNWARSSSCSRTTESSPLM